MNIPRHDSTRGGMVLFELVIALTVFALVVFALVMALDAAMTAGGERNEITAAINGLANQLTLLHEGPISPCDRDVPGDEPGITYHLIIAPETMKDQKGHLVANLYRATISAQWKSGGQTESRSLDELIYQP